MGANILNYFQKINKGFIHPKGRVASDLLIDKLAPKKGERILELGVGTGTTLSRVISRNPSINLYGVDKSDEMLSRAKERLLFCNLESKVELKQLNQDGSIPFESNSFDKIYIESVLGIQEGDGLIDLILELKRILKPKGWLYMNELLWSPKVKADEIEAINSLVKEKFGIIQANGKYPYIQDWLLVFEQQGFKVVELTKIDELKNKRFDTPKNFPELLSNLFSIKGLLQSKFNSQLRAEGKRYAQEMSNIDMTDKAESYLLTLSKNVQ